MTTPQLFKNIKVPSPTLIRACLNELRRNRPWFYFLAPFSYTTKCEITLAVATAIIEELLYEKLQASILSEHSAESAISGSGSGVSSGETGSK